MNQSTVHTCRRVRGKFAGEHDPRGLQTLLGLSSQMEGGDNRTKRTVSKLGGGRSGVVEEKDDGRRGGGDDGDLTITTDDGASRGCGGGGGWSELVQRRAGYIGQLTRRLISYTIFHLDSQLIVP